MVHRVWYVGTREYVPTAQVWVRTKQVVYVRVEVAYLPNYWVPPWRVTILLVASDPFGIMAVIHCGTSFITAHLGSNAQVLSAFHQSMGAMNSASASAHTYVRPRY